MKQQKQSLLHWRFMDNHNVGGGRHPARTLQILFFFSLASFFFSQTRCCVTMMGVRIHQAKGFQFLLFFSVKSFKDNIYYSFQVVIQQKKPGLNINDNIQLFSPINMHTRSQIKYLKKGVSSTLLAHMWLSAVARPLARPPDTQRLTAGPSWMIPQCRAVAAGSSGSGSWTSSPPPDQQQHIFMLSKQGYFTLILKENLL